MQIWCSTAKCRHYDTSTHSWSLHAEEHGRGKHLPVMTVTHNNITSNAPTDLQSLNRHLLTCLRLATLHNLRRVNINKLLTVFATGNSHSVRQSWLAGGAWRATQDLAAALLNHIQAPPWLRTTGNSIGAVSTVCSGATAFGTPAITPATSSRTT